VYVTITTHSIQEYSMDLSLIRRNLFSTDEDIVIQSLRDLSSAGDLSDVQSMLSLLKHASSSVKITASQSLLMLIKENLITCFNELDLTVKQKLGIVLQSMDPLIIDELKKDLFCEREDRRLRAVQILGLLQNNPRVKPILSKLVTDRDAKVRATAINLLGRFIGKNDHDLILPSLNDSDNRVRANTVEALECTGNKRLVPILLRFRKDPVNRIRGNAIKALYNLGFTEAEEDLMEMLNLESEFMKASALWVVTQIRIRKARFEDASASYLLAESEMIRNNAFKALNALDTPRSKGFLKYLSLPEDLFFKS